jgi:SH3-like domain-containing protein
MNYPTGKGYFIWLLYRVAGGDPVQLAQMCKEAGLSWVALKIADGAFPFYANQYKVNVDLVPAAVRELHNVGIKVFGWHYVYGYPIGESEIAVKRVRELNLDGYIIDAEVEYKNRVAEADTLISRLRKYLPAGTSIGICSYRFPSLHPEFPWRSFRTCDYNMPQVYWSLANNAGQQLQRCVYQFEHDFGYAMPTFPIGAAYEEWGWRPTVEQIIDFRTTANQMGLPGYGWWELYGATVTYPEYWQATIGKMGGEQGTVEPVLMSVMPKFDNVNMRSGPGVQYSWVGKMVRGHVYKIVEINGKWGRVEGVGKVWCHLDYTTRISDDPVGTQPILRWVKTSYTSLRIRNTPSTSGAILGYLTAGKAYAIVKIEGDWGRLSGESERWVNLNYTIRI